MPGASEDPSDPTERDPSGIPTEADPSETAGEGTTDISAGSPTEAAPGEETTNFNPERTGAWRPEPSSKFAEHHGHGEAPTERMEDDPADPAVGARIQYIGDYQLLKVIGKGGMGVVYRARQLSLNRVVALKLIRLDGTPTEAETRRFQSEAEAVASLDHPAIVPIYEVGTHEGRHYFSMKLIAGESLQQASSRLRKEYKAIGRILAGAARAVQHAHERGILHRDLKPANILLDSTDAPHVSDFGLAKRIDTGELESTQTEILLGTPAYMAPEQATATRGAITTATDVYGLGAVLYALLSGHAPHRGSSVLEILDAVREEAPEPPSKADATVPRDLEVICMKCLDKDPGRRYRSAGELADDLDRWLEGRPIAARHVGAASRAIMWCRRKPLIAGLAAALVIAVTVGTAGIVINWLELRRANAQIRAEWEASRALNEFLVTDMIGPVSPFGGARPDAPISVLLDRSAGLASSRFANRPKIEGSIRQALGSGYLSLGKLSRAEDELMRSHRLRRMLPAGDELDLLSTEYLLARLRLQQGRNEEAEALAIEAHEGRLRLLGESDEATIEAAELRAAVLKAKGKGDDARKLLEKTAQTARRVLGEEHRVTLRIDTDLVIIEFDQGRFLEALKGFARITIVATRVFGPDDPETLLVRSKLGVTLASMGQDAKAEEAIEAALAPLRDLLGPDHPETLLIGGNLAAIRVKLGKFDEAINGVRQSLEGLRKILPADHEHILRAEMNLAVILLQQGKLAEGEQLLLALIPRIRSSLKPEHPLLGIALTSRAAALMDLNRTAEAETINAEAIAFLQKTLPPDHPEIAGAVGTHAMLLLANGKPIEAETLARRVFEIRSRPDWVGNPWRLGAIKSVLGATLAAQKKDAEAEKLLLDGFRTIEADPMAVKRRRDDALERLIQFYESLGKADEAAKWRALRKAQPGR